MMNKKAYIVSFLLLLFFACDKKNNKLLSKEPIPSARSFDTVSEAPKEQPQYLSRKTEKEVKQEVPPLGGYGGPLAIPTLPVVPPLATDDDLATPLDPPGPQLFPYARCGNGLLEGVEQCDLGPFNIGNAFGCNIICEKPFCGNGVVDQRCVCADTNCVPITPTSCAIPNARACSANPTACVKIVEDCDDGNNEDGDGCSATCLFERCGNKRVDCNEDCDDGNITNGDGCSACCKVEKCGNNVLDFKEQCDDGNTTNGDGCDDCCKREPPVPPPVGALK